MSELTDVSNQLTSQNRSLRETFSEEHEKARQQADAIGNKLSEIYTHGFENQAKALGNLGKSMGKGLIGNLKKGLAFLKPSMESIKEEKRRNDEFMNAIGTFAESTKNFFKAGVDKVKDKFSFLAPIATLLKGLIIGGALFILLKKLPEIFESDLYKQMIVTIEKHIVPGIQKLFNNYIKPFLMFFVDGLTELFKDINDDNKSAGDTIKENAGFLAAALGAIAVYMYPGAIFKTVMFAGKNLLLASRLLMKGILSTGKAVMSSAINLGKSALKGLAAGAVAMKGALVSAAISLKAAALPLIAAVTPFLPIILGVAAGITLAKVAFDSIKEKWDQAPGILSKIKLIVSSILAAPINFFKGIISWVAGKLGFEDFAAKLDDFDPVKKLMDFFSNAGAFIKEKFAIVGDFFSDIDPIGAVKNFFGKIKETLSNLLPDFQLPEFNFPDFDFNPIDGLLNALANILDKFTFLGIGPKIAKFMRGAVTPDEDVEEVEKRQKGGPVKKDSLYLVGEKGPELFRPSMSGMIANSQRTTDISNRAMENALAAMKGMGQSVQNIISAPTQNVENKTENKVAIGVGTLDDNFRQLATFSF
tara:strand:+ start:136 stop:1902 length:1767 start_codon:yes stop_codon:yes gene_type:complete